MQDEAEIYEQAIKESARKLVVLKMLSNFFNHKDLFAIYVRTKVIHNLFESNKSLDINKLDLFHVQYTSSLIELFQKLKKAKEQQYLLITDEIYINDDLAAKLEKELETCNFKTEARKHSQLVAEKLKQLYQQLTDGITNSPIAWGDAIAFSTRLGQEFYREADKGTYIKLAPDGKKTYNAGGALIEHKLAGKLNKLNFRIKFTCGLQYENEYTEVFDFVDSNEKFVFLTSTKTFLLLDNAMANGLDLSKNLSNKRSIIEGLKLKNDQLREKLATIKTSLPNDVEEVTSGYLRKISGVDFLEELQNVDEQTNILRAMLNINSK